MTSLSNQRLLVIEDDVNFQKIVLDVAKSCGYEVRVIDKFDDCQQVFSEFKPTLLFLDLNLVGSDGIEVLRYLDGIGLTIPIYILSAFDEKIITTALRLGKDRGLNMAGYLTKPVALHDIMGILKQYLDIKTELTIDTFQKAVVNNEFFIYYQPKISFSSSKIVGLEALTRWQCPNEELFYPDSFIPFAEKSGFISQLTKHVVNESMSQLFNIPDHLTLSINLSAYDLLDIELPEKMERFLLSHKVDPKRICFEITESALMLDYKTIMDVITRLRVKGFSLSLDDFGTGYSSLIQLHRLPFTELKIDKRFITDLPNDKEGVVIVRSIIDLGHNLGLKVVAEGIESKEVYDLLKDMGCDIAQGYFISRPLEINKLKDFLNTWGKSLKGH